jgi:GNAT superfamily N-acetyltransferase
MKVVQIDPDDGALFDAWFAVLRETDLERWPDRPGWQRAERLAQALDTEGPEEHRCLLARDDSGQGIGMADLEMFRRENQHLARLEVRVRPAARRLGVGRALVETAQEIARSLGRSELGGMDETPVRPGFPDLVTGFAGALGFAPAMPMARRELRLPLAAEPMETLRANPKAAPAGYTMVSFADRWPDAYIADRCLLGRRMSTDVPQEGQDLDEEVWDESRVRQIEASLAEQNRAKVTTAARHDASGRLVAFTDIVIPLGAPEAAWQHDTLVIREHRGHGLGYAVKVANLEAVARAYPAVRSVCTWNATVNDHMIDINEEMGFEVISHSIYWLKRF